MECYFCNWPYCSKLLPPMTCICGETFESLDSLAQHGWDKTHLGLKCNDCDKVFGNLLCLDQHRIEVHRTCSFCEESFCQRRLLDFHMEWIHPDNLLKMEKQKAEASGQEWLDVIILYTQESSADIIERQCVNTGKIISRKQLNRKDPFLVYE